jgi:AraC family transcriptional regulator of adaptative response / DNA-3-methyladenine glycosylase II
MTAASSTHGLDPKACYRACSTRDRRFDGRFFTGVTSTGIYCRPICPARTPKPENCRFYPSAAAAQAAGFRPCLRCRPECAPDRPAAAGTGATASRALRLIEGGALDGVDGPRGVEALAARLGVSGRQLRRVFKDHLGASPVAVAQTRRLLFARRLIRETGLSMTEIALASGYNSVRRFNSAFLEGLKMAPSDVRRLSNRISSTQNADLAQPGSADLTLFLEAHGPWSWTHAERFFGSRLLAGVESLSAGRYARSWRWGAVTGTVALSPTPATAAVQLALTLSDLSGVQAVISRWRRVLDLDTDLEAVNAHLSRDPILAPLIAARPDLRLTGVFDPFELSVRAILGQQVSVAAAATLTARVVVRCGPPLPGGSPEAALHRLFPSPEAVANADLNGLGLTGRRIDSLRAMAAAFSPLPPGALPERGALLALPGIGAWTADILALRGAIDPDAFPVGDLVVARTAAALDPALSRPAALLARAEAWRPWRGYAAQHLWAAAANMGG